MTDNKNIEQQLAEINQKLELMTGYIQQQQRRQREMQELKEDLTLIGKEVFNSAVTEMDEVAHHFDISDLLFLMKKVLRNTRNLARLMDQMESAAGFVEDAAPLGKQMVVQLMESLDELEKKGYFEFGREILKIADTIVSSFTIEDVRHLRENITTILMTVKSLTQPEMLSTVNNAMNFYRQMDIPVEQKVSYRQIMKKMSDPEVKRGMIFMLDFIRNMAQNHETIMQNNNAD
ncbi:MAG: DUF1641 domain-containing protein [Calditrichia bacterium]